MKCTSCTTSSRATRRSSGGMPAAFFQPGHLPLLPFMTLSISRARASSTGAALLRSAIAIHDGPTVVALTVWNSMQPFICASLNSCASTSGLGALWLELEPGLQPASNITREALIYECRIVALSLCDDGGAAVHHDST